MLKNERYCPSCKTAYDKSNFYKDKRGVDGLTRRCKTCHSKKSYESRMKRPNIKSERYKSSRAWMLKTKYGLTLQDYNNLLDKQNGKCAICGTNIVEGYANNTFGLLVVDHDHDTGKVRGLLCPACNTGLGHFKDNIESLKKAIIYLEEGGIC